MERFDVLFKLGLAAIGSVLGYCFGPMSPLFLAFIFLVSVDYTTGVAAAIIQGKLSSAIGFKGIVRKLGLFSVIAVAHVLGGVLGYQYELRDTVTGYLIANEFISIGENWVRMGIGVPPMLKAAVETLMEKGTGR